MVGWLTEVTLGTVLGALVASVFAAWLLLSIASQLSDRVSARFPRLETLGLVPHWTFFAPRPSVHDVHLLYRDKFETDELGSVECVPTIESRRWYHGIWNPEKFRNKVIADITVSLGMQYLEAEKDERDLRFIMLSAPYMLAVNLVMRMPRPAGATARQFILARDQPYGHEIDRQLVFLSEFHRFAGEAG